MLLPRLVARGAFVVDTETVLQQLPASGKKSISYLAFQKMLRHAQTFLKFPSRQALNSGAQSATRNLSSVPSLVVSFYTFLSRLGPILLRRDRSSQEFDGRRCVVGVWEG